MKKVILLALIVFLTISGSVFAQSNKKNVKVLYFKANLACCKARACTALQTDVDSVLIKYFSNKNIEFKVIALADIANKDLVTKYNAKSQTVVIVKKKGTKETSSDVSAIVHDYTVNRNKEMFENGLKNKINEIIK